MRRVACLLLLASPALALLHPREWYESRFVDWMKEHNVEIKDGEDFVRRLDVWAENDDHIETHNSGNATYTLGHNKFSHLTSEEFQEHLGLGRLRVSAVRTGMPQPGFGWRQGRLGAMRHELPDEVDWVKKGAMTPVKDQGQCGSCWSFSTTGALEGAYFIKNQRLESFSEQMLVDCDMVDAHCNGGLMDNAFEWIQNNGGLCTEGDYPYEGAEGKCRAKTCELVKGSKVASWVDVHPTETALMAALNEGPVSVAIEADQMQFQLYKSGVFTARCGNQLDHGVLAVGYGKAEDGTLYWRVKNSWGPSWGQDGYILLERNVKQRGGQCGIALSASYPKL